MKIISTITSLLLFNLIIAQSSINGLSSGSLITPNSYISIGEIVIDPINPNQSSSSGIIGILTQINQQTLEVSRFELNSDLLVYPNPTNSIIYFESSTILLDEKISVFTMDGKQVLNSKIENDNSINLEKLSSGNYLIQFENKTINSFKIIKH